MEINKTFIYVLAIILFVYFFMNRTEGFYPPHAGFGRGCPHGEDCPYRTNCPYYQKFY